MSDNSYQDGLLYSILLALRKEGLCKILQKGLKNPSFGSNNTLYTAQTGLNRYKLMLRKPSSLISKIQKARFA